jgi:alpha-L-fucosidase
MLLNVGPTPEGVIAPEQADRIREMGDWLAKYGESIYGTRGGPFKCNTVLGSTHKGNVVYVHVLQWGGDKLVLPDFGKKIVRSSLLNGGKVEVEQKDNQITITVHQSDQQSIDTIIKLELDGAADGIAPVVVIK